jgi:hypothetical protein
LGLVGVVLSGKPENRELRNLLEHPRSYIKPFDRYDRQVGKLLDGMEGGDQIFSFVP